MNRAVKGIGACLMSMFMMSCAAKGPPIKISHKDTLGDDCAIMRNIAFSQGDKVIKVDKELIGFSELCGDHQLLAMLVNREIKNPEMEAIVTSATVEMLAEASPQFKRSVLLALAKYDITEDELARRKEIDAAVMEVMSTPETDCTWIGPDKLLCN